MDATPDFPRFGLDPERAAAEALAWLHRNSHVSTGVLDGAMRLPEPARKILALALIELLPVEEITRCTRELLGIAAAFHEGDSAWMN